MVDFLEFFEGNCSAKQAKVLLTCQEFIDWFDLAADEDIPANGKAWYNVCVKTVADLVAEIQNNCGGCDKDEILEYCAYLVK